MIRRAVWVALAAVLSAPPPAAEGGPTEKVAFSDRAVGRAIERGVAYLVSQRREDGTWPRIDTHGEKTWTVGPTAVCAYALLEAGVPTGDPNMGKTLAFLGETETDTTYGVALRSLVWASAIRQGRVDFPARLRRDAACLIRSMSRSGGYGYTAACRPPTRKDFSAFAGHGPDASNSQYGLLGVWAAARTGQEVPRGYWQRALKYWQAAQNPDGGWGYSRAGKSGSYMAMTLAGVASLYVCYDNLYAARFMNCRPGGSGTAFPEAERGLAWVAEHFDDLTTGADADENYYYTLYGLQRVGLATGRKFLGQHDWYREAAAELLRRQEPDGAWRKPGGIHSGGPNTATAYAVLFLVHGREGLFVNRLKYDGDWDNRPRAVANLSRWINRAVECGSMSTWQIIDVRTPPESWHDASVLFVTGAEAPTFTDDDLDRLRTYVHQGGSLFSITECDGEGFRDGIRETYARLFPGRTMSRLPAKHMIRKELFRIPPDVPLLGVSNGARLLAVHTDTDLAKTWQLNMSRTRTHAYKVAANVVTCAGGMAWLDRHYHRGPTTDWPATFTAPADRTLTVVRLRHGGNWNPEPLALERFGRLMGHRTRTRVREIEPVAPAGLAGSGAQLAVMTGTGKLALSAADRAALKAWLAGGGTLVADAAGGNRAFAESAKVMLDEVLGDGVLRPLPADDPLCRVGEGALTRDALRRRTRQFAGADDVPTPLAASVAGRRAVIFSPLDLTCGLIGSGAATIGGYRPQAAFALVRNVALTVAAEE